MTDDRNRMGGHAGPSAIARGLALLLGGFFVATGRFIYPGLAWAGTAVSLLGATIIVWAVVHRDRGLPPPPEPGQIGLPTRHIPNEDLTEADMPAADATWPHGIWEFAATFHGYEHWGSFEKCYDVGKLARTRDLQTLSLTELRTVLFCTYRTLNHMGDYTPNDDERARVIIEQIRDRVKRGAIA